MRPSSISFESVSLRDLAADGIERREHDRLRGVVDDEVDAGQVLERADVPPLPTDDPPLHVIAGELDERDRGLRRVARRHPLQRVGDEVPGTPLRLGAGLFLDLAHPARRARAGRGPPCARAAAASPRCTVMPAIRWSSASSCAFVSFRSSWSCRMCVSRSATPCSRRVSSSCFDSTSFLEREHAFLDPDDLRAARLHLLVDLGAQLELRSRASIWASRLTASASRRASSMTSAARCSAPAARDFSQSRKTSAPAAAPATSPMAIPMKSMAAPASRPAQRLSRKSGHAGAFAPGSRLASTQGRPGPS